MSIKQLQNTEATELAMRSLRALADCDAFDVLERTAITELSTSDALWDAGFRIALLKALRERSVRDGGPSTVAQLPLEAVCAAASIAYELTDVSPDLQSLLQWIDEHSLAPWAVGNSRWRERQSSARVESIDAAEAARRLTGRTVIATRFDTGAYVDAEAGWARGELILDGGDVVVFDCKDRVCGYDHPLDARQASAHFDAQEDAFVKSVESEVRLPDALQGLVASPIIEAAERTTEGAFELELRQEGMVTVLTAPSEGVLVWHSSPAACPPQPAKARL